MELGRNFGKKGSVKKILYRSFFMGRTTKVVNFSLPLDLYKKTENLARRRKVPKSQILKEALEAYVASEERWEKLRAWGVETAETLGLRSEEDIEKLLHEYRKEL